MKREWLTGMLVLFGCGPLVASSEETDGGGSTGGDSGLSSSSSTASPGEASSGSEGPLTTAPMPTTLPPSTSGFDSSSAETTAAPMGGWCWGSIAEIPVPEESRFFEVDQDGDGTEELWLSVFESSNPEGISALFRFSPDGNLEAAGGFPGFVSGLHDLDGDGVLDGVGFAVGQALPPSLRFVPGVPGLIDGPPFELSLSFDDGFEGFIDVSGDGRVDVFRNVADDMETDLLVGDGQGGFAGQPSMPSPFPGNVAATPSDDPSLVVLSQTSFFEPLKSCIEHPFTPVAVSGNSLVALATGQAIEPWVPSAVIGAVGEGQNGIVYARACDGVQGTVTLQIHQFEGGRASTGLFPEASFVALGDFDGDGHSDIALGELGGGIQFYAGESALSFAEPVFDEVPYGEPLPSRVYTADIDQDGREELIVGTRTGGKELLFQRLDLEPC